MTKFRDIKITTKLIMSFAIILMSSALLGVLQLNFLKTAENFTINMYKHPFAVSNAVKDITVETVLIRNGLLTISNETNESKIEDTEKLINEQDARISEYVKILYDRFLGDISMVDKANDSLAEWREIRGDIISLSKQGKKKEVIEIISGYGGDQYTKILDALFELNDFAQEKAISFNNNATKTNKTNNTIIVVLTIIIILSGTVLATLMSKFIGKRMKKYIEVISEIAKGDGDLSLRTNFVNDDEFGIISKYTDMFIEEVSVLVKMTKDSSKNLSLSSTELFESTEDANRGLETIVIELSNVTTNINSNTETIDLANETIESIALKSSSIKEMSENTLVNSNDIQTSADLGLKNINEVSDIISKVDNSTGKVYAEIKELVLKSNEIGEIITIITSITEQTNLLALNAAIEAARAGEHGRGFAVVAEEVRKLADESGKSAEKISKLIAEVQEKAAVSDANISESQDFVRESVEKTELTRKQFALILEGLNNMAKDIEIISSESVEQYELSESMKKSMSEVVDNSAHNTEAVNGINDVIQSQVASFEEIGARIEELSSMSIVLNDMTEKYKV